MNLDEVVRVAELVFQIETLKKENDSLKKDLEIKTKESMNYNQLVNETINIKNELNNLRIRTHEEKVAVEWCSSMGHPFKTIYQAVGIYRNLKVKEFY